MTALWQDLRFAIRSLLKAPGFTALAAFTLALGIGANTAIFSVVQGVVLEPLPYENPQEIVRVWPARRFSKEMLAAFEEGTTKGDNRVFSAISGHFSATLSLLGTDNPEELTGLAVTPDHFRVLGGHAAIGRELQPQDRQPGAPPVVVLSHSLWERRFAADPNLLGRSVSLDGLGHGSRTVVGVMAADFTPLEIKTQFWVPVTFDASNLDDYRDMMGFVALARLAPGSTLHHAEAEVRANAARLQETLPDYHPEDLVRSARVMPLHQVLIGDVRPILWILLGAVGFVLLIGCSNIANMLLARAGNRHREMAIRASLGAERGRLIRQLLTESALLGVLGGSSGLLAAIWLESLLIDSLPAGIPRVDAIHIGLPELGFAAILSVAAALLAGLLPALRATRPQNRGTLRSGSRRSSAGPGRHRLNQGLVITEIALSVVLVAGAGLMLKSLWLLQRVEPGFGTTNLLTLRLSPADARYADEDTLNAYYQGVLDEVEALPGVVAASAINFLPMTTPNVRMSYSLSAQVIPESSAPVASVRAIAPNYFDTMDIPLLAGREVASADRAGAVEVGWINQTLAQQGWPDQDPVGQQIFWSDGTPWFTIAGVTRDVHQHRLDLAARAAIYRPLYQAGDEILSNAMFLTVRTATPPSDLAPAVRKAIWSVDSEVPLFHQSMDQIIDTSLASSRFFTLLLAAFGALALALGAIGVYGVGSYAVSQRIREIGIRMALGAQRRVMLRSLMAREMTPVAVGVVVGVVGALAATRVLANSLYGVTTTDPATFATVALVLATVAAVASFLPARRASRVDPTVALRAD